MKAFAGVLLLALCVACVSTGNGKEGVVYLPRVVALDVDVHYPDPLHYGGAPPEDLQEAVTFLLQSMKLTPRALRGSDACDFSDIDDLDLRLGHCLEVACERLPRTTREKGCGYLVRVADWYESEWLGGLCRMQSEPRSGPLPRWFRGRGIDECHSMSTAITVSLAQSLVGGNKDEAALLAILKSGQSGGQ